MADLEPDIRNALRSIGLHNPDPTEPLHIRLVDAIRRTRGAGEGVQLLAMKFEFNAELLTAGRVYATNKTDYEHRIDMRKSQLMLDPATNYSAAKAEAIAKGEPEAYQLLLDYRVAEQRERGIRNFLATIANALELHRTDRADQRAADRYEQESTT